MGRRRQALTNSDCHAGPGPTLRQSLSWPWLGFSGRVFFDVTSSPSLRPAPSGQERCQQCGAASGGAQQIAHLEVVHSGGWASSAVDQERQPMSSH